MLLNVMISPHDAIVAGVSMLIFLALGYIFGILSQKCVEYPRKSGGQTYIRRLSIANEYCSTVGRWGVLTDGISECSDEVISRVIATANRMQWSHHNTDVVAAIIDGGLITFDSEAEARRFMSVLANESSDKHSDYLINNFGIAVRVD